MISPILKYKRYMLLFLVVFVSFLLLSIHGKLSRSSDNYLGIISSVFYPFQNTANRVFRWSSNTIMEYVDVEKLKEENMKVNKELNELRGEYSRLREAIHENARLRNLLALKTKVPVKTIPAEVIARDSTVWFKTIIVNKGSDEGVEKDMAVISPDGIVGKVVDAGKKTSVIQLILDPNCSIGAIIQRSRAQGIVEGDVKGLLRMKYLSKDSDIEKDDIVVTSGIGGIFPKGLPIGYISDIDRQSSHLFKYATIIPSASFSKIEEVLIVKNHPNLDLSRNLKE